MATQSKHLVTFRAHKKVKESVEVKFKTKDGTPVDFIAEKPVQEVVKVKFLARDQKRR